MTSTADRARAAFVGSLSHTAEARKLRDALDGMMPPSEQQLQRQARQLRYGWRKWAVTNQGVLESPWRPRGRGPEVWASAIRTASGCLSGCQDLPALDWPLERGMRVVRLRRTG